MNSLTVIYISLISCSVFFLVVNAVLQIRVKQIAESTHTIVNNQRTMMLRSIALLTRFAQSTASSENHFGISKNLPTSLIRVTRGQIQPVEAFDSTSSVNNSEGFFQL